MSSRKYVTIEKFAEFEKKFDDFLKNDFKHLKDKVGWTFWLTIGMLTMLGAITTGLIVAFIVN